MTKKERIEDLGIIWAKLTTLLDDEIFENLDSKHCFERWKEVNHDRVEDGEARGLYHIHFQLRNIYDKLHDICYIARGEEEE